MKRRAFKVRAFVTIAVHFQARFKPIHSSTKLEEHQPVHIATDVNATDVTGAKMVNLRYDCCCAFFINAVLWDD
jgi:hypothetical protein